MPTREQLIAALSPILMEGEVVYDVATGMVQVRRMGSDAKRSGTVAVTDRRVILFTKKLGGYDVQDFAFGLLTSLDHKKGFQFGNLDLAASGDRARVTMIPKGDVERIAQAIRQRMAAAHTSASAPRPDDFATRLRELASLRDEGLITSEEFEAKKRQLLDL